MKSDERTVRTTVHTVRMNMTRLVSKKKQEKQEIIPV